MFNSWLSLHSMHHCQMKLMAVAECTWNLLEQFLHSTSYSTALTDYLVRLSHKLNHYRYPTVPGFSYLFKKNAVLM